MSGKSLSKLIILLPCLLFAACGPAGVFLTVDVKLPAVFPIPARDKTLAVFVAQNGNETDSLLRNALARSLQKNLEAQLHLDTGSVAVYNHYPADFGPMDSLAATAYDKELAREVEADLAFMVDEVSTGLFEIYDRAVPETAYPEASDYFSGYVSLPYRADIGVFDVERGRRLLNIPVRDTIVWEEVLARNAAKVPVPQDAFSDLMQVSADLGENLARNFVTHWEEQDRVLFTYSQRKWNRAAQYARNFQWEEAQALWLELSEQSNAQALACVYFNLAVASEMLGKIALARDWLEQSKKYWISPYTRDYEALLEARVSEKAKLIRQASF